MSSTPLDINALTLEHRRLAGLAARLVADHHGGEDLAQEGAYRWVLAQREGRWSGDDRPGSADRLAWLKQAVRRLAANQRRGETHRRDREIAAASPEEIPSTAEIAARAEACRRLHEAVEALPPLYAEVLRDHYLGDLPVASIAQRDGLTVSGVKSRIQRARAELRELLERRGLGGDDGQPHWAVALLPAASSAGWAKTTGAAGVAESTYTSFGLPTLIVMKKIVAGVLALICAGSLWFIANESGIGPSERPAAAGTEALTVEIPGLDPEPGEPMQALLDAPPGRSVLLEPLAEEAVQPMSSPRTIRVTSLAGFSLDTAYFQDSESGPRVTLDRRGTAEFVLEEDGLISAPGHLARRVLADDEAVELEPAGLLRVRARGLRAGCHRVNWDGYHLDTDLAMRAETSFGFTGDDEFSVAVDAERWPNYNLRAEPRLTLQGGMEVSISFLPLDLAEQVVNLLLEESDLTGERRDLVVQLEGGASLPAGESIRVAAKWRRSPAARVSRKRGPWGTVMMTEPFQPVTGTGVAPGPFTMESLVVGRRYGLSLLAEGGAHASGEILFDGSSATLSWNSPASISANVTDEDGRHLDEVKLTAWFPALGAEAQSEALWSELLAGGITCRPAGASLAVTIPYDPGRAASIPGPLPPEARFRFESPGHEAVLASGRLVPGEITDLGQIVLPTRKDGIEVLGDPEGRYPFTGQFAWLDPATGKQRREDIGDAVPGARGCRVVYMENRSAFEAGWPDEMVYHGRGIVRATREGGQRYRLEPKVDRNIRFVLDRSLLESGTEVDLTLKIGASSYLFYTFRREAIGTTRSLSVTGPEEDAIVQWGVRNANAPEPVEWHEIGPLNEVPDSVELTAPR